MTYDKAFEARKLFFGSHTGVLSTLSTEQDIKGYPFGSLTPYALDGQGQAIIQISDIAQHTKNIMSDHRVSLTIIETAIGEVQAHGRFTYLGKAVKVADEEEKEIGLRYTTLFPESKGYNKAHGFNFYQIQFQKGRFIGGFGKIFWISAGEFLLKNNFTIEEESKAINHLTHEYKDVIKNYLNESFNVKVENREDISIARVNPFGFDIRLNKNLYFYPFTKTLSSYEEIQTAIKGVN